MKNVLHGTAASTVAACALLALAGGASHAQTLAGYTFDNGGGSTLFATTTAANVTASAISPSGSANITPALNNTLGYSTGYVYQITVATAAATTAATAVAQNTYFQFTVAPTAGSSLSLTNLSFLAGRGGASTARGYTVRSSVDNYTADLGTSLVASQRPSADTYNVALTFNNLTTATTFRIYTFTPASGQSVEYDNIALSGSVAPAAAPEPSSLGLAATVLPLAGFVLARRKRRASN